MYLCVLPGLFQALELSIAAATADPVEVLDSQDEDLKTAIENSLHSPALPDQGGHWQTTGMLDVKPESPETTASRDIADIGGLVKYLQQCR